MNNKEKIQREIEKADFVKINGKILRTLNVIPESSVSLTSLEYTFNGVEHSSFINSVKYLNLSGYVELKNRRTKKAIAFSESEYEETEISLTAKGIRALCGAVEDECIET